MYEEQAKRFIEAIKALAERPANLDNLETYLTYHFANWLHFYGTPAAIAADLQEFANLKIGGTAE